MQSIFDMTSIMEPIQLIDFRGFVMTRYHQSTDTTSIYVLKLSSDMSTINSLVISWLESMNLDYDLIDNDDDLLTYIHLANIDGNHEFNSISIDHELPCSSSNIIETVEHRGRFEITTHRKHESSINIPIYVEHESESSLEPLCNDPTPEPVKYAAPELGEIGEEAIFDLVTSTFPTFENSLVSSTAHVADIHSIDLDHKLMFVYEVKNKRSITAEDVSKFGRDLETLTQQHPDHKIIGIFISLNCPIPKIGYCAIEFDRCYLATHYVCTDVLELVISMYTRILTRIERHDDRIQYDVPVQVYRLLSELRGQYSTLVSNRDAYEEQIRMNTKSSELMQNLLAKTNVQLDFVTYINTEFGDILGQSDVVNAIAANDETRLRAYIQSKGKSKVTKKELLQQFPGITKLRDMTIATIRSQYGTQ